MINVKRSGRFIIPDNEAFIGYTGDNLNVTKTFFVEELVDLSLIFRMYLLFDDGTSNFFLLDSEVVEGGTKLTWTVTNEQIYKSGIVKMQIKASNNSGLVFHSDVTSLLVQRSIEFSESYKEKVNAEFLQHEQRLNELVSTCNSVNSAAEATLNAIRGEKPFTTADFADGSITRAKLDSTLQDAFDEFSSRDYLEVVDLGELTSSTAFNTPNMTSEVTKFKFVCKGALATALSVASGTPGELTCNNGWQILTLANMDEKKIRKILTIAPVFSAEAWREIIPKMRSECSNKFSALQNTIGTLNSALESALSGA